MTPLTLNLRCPVLQSGALSLVGRVEIVLSLVESFIELKYFHDVASTRGFGTQNICLLLAGSLRHKGAGVAASWSRTWSRITAVLHSTVLSSGGWWWSGRIIIISIVSSHHPGTLNVKDLSAQHLKMMACWHLMLFYQNDMWWLVVM